MSPLFLIGAILGSGVAIFGGRRPAQWALERLQARLGDVSRK